MTQKIIATNKKAYHDFTIEETFDAGVVLEGCEVKSIRNGKITLKDSFARVKNNELWLFNCHINPYTQGNRYNPDPERDRKLLLKKQEIHRIIGKIEVKGYTLVPTKVYLSGQYVKIQLGLAKAKKNHDKREDLKNKAVKKEMDRALNQRA
ncbi:MAG: SsrA-binding protein SmpB [bacterium]|nr:SsrA-binding protein SmpB [bacterium]